MVAERRVRGVYQISMNSSPSLIENKKPVPLPLRVKFRIADRIVFRRVKERFGGNIRVMISGGAALNPTIARWFGAMDITVLEGWGLTETCAPATCNRENDFKFGTVGKALPGVELKIAEDGEILVRTPGMFKGYHKDKKATKAAFSGDWFRTGDLGSLDDEGFLSITGRKKEIIVTAGGKNIPPIRIEELIERSPWIGKAVAIGSERAYITALISPDDEALDELANASP